MAGNEDYRTLCADDKDEIEGLNEKLLQLLSEQKVSPHNQALYNNRIESNSDSKVESQASASPIFGPCRHDCSLLHYDSPAKALSANLPPIGVFWDIENCQVTLSISHSEECVKITLCNRISL